MSEDEYKALPESIMVASCGIGSWRQGSGHAR